MQAGWSPWMVDGEPCLTMEPPLPAGHGETVIYLPDHATCRDAWPLIQQLAALTPLAEETGIHIAVPVADGTWWTDRIDAPFSTEWTAEQFVVEGLCRALAQRWQATTPRIALLGVGSGGQAALRLAYRHPQQFPIAAAVSPVLDFHHQHEAGDAALRRLYRDSEQARQDTATLHIHPLNWPRNQWFCCDPTDFELFDGVERLRMKLFSLGVPYEGEFEAAASSRAEYAEQMLGSAMEFIAERLQRERLRVT